MLQKKQFLEGEIEEEYVGKGHSRTKNMSGDSRTSST